jgi:hypothetical protein
MGCINHKIILAWDYLLTPKELRSLGFQLGPRSRGATKTHHLKNLENFPLKSNERCLIFPIHPGKMRSAKPLGGLDPLYTYNGYPGAVCRSTRSTQSDVTAAVTEP